MKSKSSGGKHVHEVGFEIRRCRNVECPFEESHSELLEALKNLLFLYSEVDGGDKKMQEYIDAKKAISRAEGKV